MRATPQQLREQQQQRQRAKQQRRLLSPRQPQLPEESELPKEAPIPKVNPPDSTSTSSAAPRGSAVKHTHTADVGLSLSSRRRDLTSNAVTLLSEHVQLEVAANHSPPPLLPPPSVSASTSGKAAKHSKLTDLHHYGTTNNTIVTSRPAISTIDAALPDFLSVHLQTPERVRRQYRTGRAEKEKAEELPVPKFFEQLPLDFSLKRQVRILSSKPFQFAKQLRSLKCINGVHAFTTNSFEAQNDVSLFQASRMYWVYPAPLDTPPASVSSMSTSSVGARPSQTIVSSLPLNQARSLKAFASVYDLFRVGHAPYFYLVDGDFSVLFVSQGFGQLAGPCAIFPQSNTGVRAALTAADVLFEMPLLVKSSVEELLHSNSMIPDNEPTTAEDDESHPAISPVAFELNDGDAQSSEGEADPTGAPSPIIVQRSKRRKINRGIDGTTQSMIVIRQPYIHALYNCLINRQTLLRNGSSQLLCPTAFECASLESLPITLNTTLQRPKVTSTSSNTGLSKSKAAAEQLETLHCLELAGPIIPSQFEALITALTKLHGEDSFYVELLNHSTFMHINAAFPKDVTGATDSSDHFRQSVILGSGALSCVRYHSGTFECQW